MKQVRVNTKKKILLGQLGAFGDCLYATAIARQIKYDYPNCYLTWAISSTYASILINNPYIDEVLEIEQFNDEEIRETWERFEILVKGWKTQNIFDEIFLTQVYPNQFKNFDGTVRSSIFRGYPRPITVPVTPVIRLAEGEVNKVRSFADKYDLKNCSKVILFECSHKSGQSFVTSEFAYGVAKKIVNQLKDVKVILTSPFKIVSEHTGIIDGSFLTFRENAELSKFCHLLIGCSSGISWLCTSDWAKKIPTIQLLKKSQSVFASMVHDFKHFGLDFTYIIEMTDCEEDHLVGCIKSFFNEGFTSTYSNYHETISVNFDFYFDIVENYLQNSLEDYYSSFLFTYERYGLDFLFQHCKNLLKNNYSMKTNFEEKLLTLQNEIGKLRAENNNLHIVCDERLKLIQKLHGILHNEI